VNEKNGGGAATTTTATTTVADETADLEPAGVERAEDESKYLHGAQLWLLTIGLLLTVFVIALDNTIIATAIPKITSVFDSLDDVGWYGSAYLLTSTSLQPLFGKVYTYFDVKWTYLSALVVFEVGSVLCAAATSSTMLIVGRAVAGLGCAALFSGALTIVGYSVSIRRRPLYIAALASMFGVASVVGPILGGAFTDRLTWRWCFWINLPFGGVTMAAVLFFFRNPPRPYADMTTKDKLKQIDFIGAFVLICAIVCLLLALQWGGSTYPWSDSRVWGCLLGFGLIISLFIAIQFYLGDRATMPPRILGRQRTVAGCAIFGALLGMALYTHIYFLPFYFQAVKGVNAEQSGIRCIPYLVSITLSAGVSGAIITYFGPYNPMLYIGTIIFTVGCGLLHTLTPDSSTGQWIGYQLLAGIGAGTCVQIPFLAVQVVLEEKDMPVGNAIAIFFNTLGGAITISIAQNIFTNTLIEELPKKAPGINVHQAVEAGATYFRYVVPPNLLQGAIEAYNIAVTTAFITPIAVAGLAFLSTFLFEWKSVKGMSMMPGAV